MYHKVTELKSFIMKINVSKYVVGIFCYKFSRNCCQFISVSIVISSSIVDVCLTQMKGPCHFRGTYEI